VCVAARGKWSGGRKEDVVHRVAAGVLLLKVVRVHRGAVPIAASEPEQSKERSTTVNTYTSPPSSTVRQRLHRRPNVR
jgi:hypothetical protein